jgi:hypothetical protein
MSPELLTSMAPTVSQTASHEIHFRRGPESGLRLAHFHESVRRHPRALLGVLEYWLDTPAGESDFDVRS